MPQIRLDEKEIYDALMSQSDADVDEQFEEYELKMTPSQKYITAKRSGMKHQKVTMMIEANRKLSYAEQEMLKELAKPEKKEEEESNGDTERKGS